MDGCGTERGQFWDSGDDVMKSRICEISLQMTRYELNLQRLALVFSERYHCVVTMFER